MYQPPAFRETDLATQQAFIAAHPLGLLISGGTTGLIANPIPFILYPEEGEFGTLRAHLSRGNAQWKALAESPDALIVFQGAEHYITPSWYAQKAVDGKVVPTWNYATVQARGTALIIEDAAWLLGNVSALTDQQEGRRTKPWAVSDAPDAFIAGQLKGIVGIEIAIASLEAKFKASQNRSEADRHGVVEGLADEPSADAAAMRELVKARGGGLSFSPARDGAKLWWSGPLGLELSMAVIRHEPLDHPLESQHELHLLPWPYLAVLFAVLTLVVFFVVAN